MSDDLESMSCRELNMIYTELASFDKLCPQDQRYFDEIKRILYSRGYRI